MSKKTDWETQAGNFLKAELIRRDINYDELRQALEKLGVQKTTNNLTVTINRGKFSFAFLLQCAKAIGIEKLQLD